MILLLVSCFLSAVLGLLALEQSAQQTEAMPSYCFVLLQNPFVVHEPVAVFTVRHIVLTQITVNFC